MSPRDSEIPADPITWQRLRAIFGNPPLVLNVTEKQFDYNDDKLAEMGRTRHDEIDFGDLWYYHHDLAYVELQPELFAHLFPVCLMDWHLTLLAGEGCSHGDSEFHYGLIHGNVLEKMVTDRQRTEICDVFRDSMLYRMDRERGFWFDGTNAAICWWLYRLNSLGLIIDTFQEIWTTWWEAATVGRAVCLLKFCGSLMYLDGENPLDNDWTSGARFGGPYPWEHDAMIFDRGLLETNVQFIREFVTTERVTNAVNRAADRLNSTPEGKIAAKMAADLSSRLDLVAYRIGILPDNMADHHVRGSW